MKVLITGVAGFIGAAVCKRLLDDGKTVTGLDNINDYYSQDLKFARLELLGIPKYEIDYGVYSYSEIYSKFSFLKLNLEDSEAIEKVFEREHFDIVINLAAQGGVRYSVDHPEIFIKSNIDGFLNILEGCRRTHVKHLVYASSSSVYGLNEKMPFSEHDSTTHPVSLYAATKKSNELMAHAYSHLYKLPTTGLRFFTIYGPWGRPDMSPYLFIDAILNSRPIRVFNNGDMWRDFTYIDDIVECVVRIAEVTPQTCDNWNSVSPDPAASKAPFRIYNVGNGHPVRLLDYIEYIEKASKKKALKVFMPMQPGDVYRTYADSSILAETIGYTPCTPIEQGIAKTVEWMKIWLDVNQRNKK